MENNTKKRPSRGARRLNISLTPEAAEVLRQLMVLSEEKRPGKLFERLLEVARESLAEAGEVARH